MAVTRRRQVGERICHERGAQFPWGAQFESKAHHAGRAISFLAGPHLLSCCFAIAKNLSPQHNTAPAARVKRAYLSSSSNSGIWQQRDTARATRGLN
jgi:hypothetical protein